MEWGLFLVTLSFTLIFCDGGSSETLRDIFYKYIVDDVQPCFRLTNATHQIGCSASATSTRGVVYYVNDSQALSSLQESSPHAPYIVLLEPVLFTGEYVLALKTMEPIVKGILVRYNPDFMASNDSGLSDFSPERQCPNDGYGEDSSSCAAAWNPVGNDLLFTDFGDFPIFAINATAFDDLIECYDTHGSQANAGNAPLCSVELTADMAVIRDTPTCFRRQENGGVAPDTPLIRLKMRELCLGHSFLCCARKGLPIPYLNGINYCRALGDYSVWGSLFNLTDSTSDQVILLTAKLDSVSFFPGVLSPGASSEVAAIATLLAVIDQLGEAKRTGNVVKTNRRILYSFLHGESWDYIGSSRMAFDMKNGRFPHNMDLPRIGLNNISHFLELGQLGLISDKTVIVHGNEDSDLMTSLKYYAENEGFLVNSSGRTDLPPASLQRFLREGVKDNNPDFTGSILTSFKSQFDNKFYGSRFDNLYNFGNRSILQVSEDLAHLATAIAKAVFNSSKPECNGEFSICENVTENMSANRQLIEDVLTCFLVNNDCLLFKNVFINQTAKILFSRNSTWISRYVTVTSLNNTETVILRQLVAYLSANYAKDRILAVACSDCLSRIVQRDDKTVNVTWMQDPEGSGIEAFSDYVLPKCLCIESFTYSHSATSPAFDFNFIGYDSANYSTWAESEWKTIGIRAFLKTSALQEVEFLLLGLFLTAVTLIVSVQCTRKGTLIFDSGMPYNSMTGIN